MPHTDAGRQGLAHEPAHLRLQKVAIFRPGAHALRMLAPQRKAHRRRSPGATRPEGHERGGVFILGDERLAGPVSQVTQIEAIHLPRPVKRLAADLKPASSGLRADRFGDERAARYGHGFLTEDARQFLRLVGVKNAPLAKLRDVIEQPRVRIAACAQGDHTDRATVLGDFLDQAFVGVRLLRISGIGKQNDVALACGRGFELVPCGLEAVIDIDAAASAIDAAHGALHLLTIRAHGLQWHHFMRLTVHGEDGEQILRPEEADRVRRALVSQLHLREAVLHGHAH